MDRPGGVESERPLQERPVSSEQKPSFRRWVLSCPFTCLIVAVNVGVFLLAERSGDTMDVSTLVAWGASERGRIWAGEYWRFVTPMFLHIGWFHLAVNTWVLFGWCATVERTMGSWRFLTVYLLSGAGASAASVLCHDAVAAGASGAGFGVVGVTLALVYRRAGGWVPFVSDPGVKRLLVNLALLVLIGFALPVIDNFAHGGGLIFGVALGFALTIPPGAPGRVLMPVGVGLVLAGTAAAAAHPWPGQQARYGLLNEVTERCEKGDYDGALRLLDRAEAFGGPPVMVHARRGEIYSRKGEDRQALAEFERALELEPGLTLLYRSMGHARYNLRLWREALADFRRAAEAKLVEPEHEAYCHLWIWLSRARLGEREEAVREFAAYFKSRAPFEGDHWFRKIGDFVVGALSEADFLKAAESPELKVRLERRCEAYFYAGSVRLLSGERDAARDYFTTCVQTEVTAFVEYSAAKAELEAMGK